MSRALLIIDAEQFDQALQGRVQLARMGSLQTLPALWTLTVQAPHGFPDRYGFLPDDRLFIKPDVESALEMARNTAGTNALDHMAQMGLRTAFIAGSTFYGCVLQAARDLRNRGINPVIIRELTDIYSLTEHDHAEAAADWEAARIETQSLADVSARLKRPKPRPAP